ncbi:unnamed protein product [Malus baccata var. baccata]
MLGKLKFINLSYCQYLKETPDFTNVLNLEMLILQSCMSLIEIHQSISTLTNLLVLNLNGCKKLKILAGNIRMKSLKTLDLSGCSSLKMFPEISEIMEELSALNLSGSKIKELPSSINNLTGLSYLDLKDCKELKSLPSSICQLKSLTYVTLSGCTKFEVFPSIEENMEGLRELHLDGTSIKELSPSIERLQGLELLNLSNCKSLVHLPDTLCNLARLLALNISGCTNLSQLPVDLVRLWDNAVETDNLPTDVLTRVKHSQSSSPSSKDNGLVGMDSHMHEMHLLLHPPGVETNGVRVVGIWGMGGLGKTTIARAIYDEIACQFDACCFFENVKEVFKTHGELHLQTQLLSSISGNKVGSSDRLNKGFEVMLKSLGKRKVLVVLDDVDELAQIEALLGEQHSFGGGSRILITTRDLQVLSGADAIYSPKIFSDAGALELFRRYAFRKNQPTKDYGDLSRRAIKYAQGLPLALKVLGGFLNGKTVREWVYVLEKLREVPLRGINDVLRTGFDGLDHKEKNIFLDIACFFKGMKKDYAIEILDSCGFNPHIGIRVLIDRGLITVSGEGELKMHALVEEMGREIVRQECIQEPGRRSRLWSYEDVHHVLTQNTATEAVESIILDLSNSDEVWLNAEAFVSMTQLRLLKINHAYCKLHLIGHLKFLSRKLRCLSWLGFPFKSLPSYCQFKNLVDLDMRYSLIDRLWEGTQTLEKLKFINLSYSQYLKETPDFTRVPNLEKLILQSCTSLIEVHPSLWTLTKLVLLNLNGCEELKILANSIHMKSLKTLDLSGCSSLEMFPEILEVMEELSELNLSRSKIKELPSSINNLTGLSYLNLKDCKELKRLPDTLFNLAHLVHLNVSGCTNLSQLLVNMRI